jgi:hypothetical protein
MSWRPENWDSKYRDVQVFKNLTFLNPNECFEAGADAMLKSLLENIDKLSWAWLRKLGFATYADDKIVLTTGWIREGENAALSNFLRKELEMSWLINPSEVLGEDEDDPPEPCSSI